MEHTTLTKTVEEYLLQNFPTAIITWVPSPEGYDMTFRIPGHTLVIYHTILKSTEVNYAGMEKTYPVVAFCKIQDALGK